VQRYWQILASTQRVLDRFQGSFLGKTSPVHLFWHSFDLARARYSGRPAPQGEGTDPISAEAYSHEVIAFGFSPGDDRTPNGRSASPRPSGTTPATGRWPSSATTRCAAHPIPPGRFGTSSRLPTQQALRAPAGTSRSSAALDEHAARRRLPDGALNYWRFKLDSRTA
jgi:hypothetical protein